MKKNTLYHLKLIVIQFEKFVLHLFLKNNLFFCSEAMKKDYNVQMLMLVLVMTMREKYTEVKDNKRKQPQQSSKLKSLHRFLPIKKHENITHKTGKIISYLKTLNPLLFKNI